MTQMAVPSFVDWISLYPANDFDKSNEAVAHYIYGLFMTCELG